MMDYSHILVSEGKEAISEKKVVPVVSENGHSEQESVELVVKGNLNATKDEAPGAKVTTGAAGAKNDRQLTATSIKQNSRLDTSATERGLNETVTSSPSKPVSVMNTTRLDTSATERGRNETVTRSPSKPVSVVDTTFPSQHGVSAKPYNSHCAIPGTDSKLPKCPFCQSSSFDTVTVYLEDFVTLNIQYQNSYTKREKAFPEACRMPDGMKCVLQHTDTKADVVFRMQWFIRDKYPVRYCYPQIISIINSEAEGPGYRDRPQVKHAEITIDFHITSEVLIADGCQIDAYREAMTSWSPPNPKEHQGVAMFLSHCKEVKWRYVFIQELLKLVHIDMHGTCFHNVPGKSDRFQGDFVESFTAKVRKYRAVLVFENHREESYISEKIFAAYSAGGVVPIYHGAPDVHMWLPGNHTYVDATKYKTPQALADYIKLLLTSDTVYEYHTSNYDTEKVITFLDQHCPPKDDYICHLCRHAYKLKKDSFHNGTRHCNCN